MYKTYDLGVHTSADSNEFDVDLSSIDFKGVRKITVAGRATRLAGSSNAIVVRPVTDFNGTLPDKVYLPYTVYSESLYEGGYCISVEPIVSDLSIRFKISTLSNRLEARVFVIAHYGC